MTREEVKSCIFTIKMLQKLAYNIHGVMDVVDADNCKKIIKALKQEPCEDCVSREQLNKLYNEYRPSLATRVCEFGEKLKELPSVTPQQKTGHWIEKYAEDACGERYSYWACSECGRDVGFNLANIEDVLSDYPYCHCGAKMVELQESEDKE